MKGKRRGAVADRRSVSHQLREAIEADGRTAYGLGRDAEVDPGLIQRFLNEERSLNLPSVDRLASALGLKLVLAGRPRGRPRKARAGGPALPEGADSSPEAAECS